MQTYEAGDRVTPFQVNKHKLWGDVIEIRRWGRGYSCHVRWDPELWRLNGKKHPQDGWYPQNKLWPASPE